MNYDYDKNGLPSACHVWEAQFVNRGDRSLPTTSQLQSRINLIEKAIKVAKANGVAPRKIWAREIDWRKRQKQNLTQEAKDGRDVEHQE